ncbi:MAG: hypothetical protein LBF97_02940, partial [Elusimicrobiota bacterium]|nr:hypothetical protein [Elusimicrobiota bacterium]
ESENIKVNYFGNPLIDIVNEKKSIENNNENYENQKNFYEKNFLIGIMPGSRISEIKNILPIIIKLLNILIEKSKTNLELKSKLDNIKFVLILAENIDEDFLKLNFSKFSENEKYSKFFNIVEIVKGPAYILRQKMKFILTSSGTSSFENTILGIPMMIFYKLDLFSYNFAKLIIKIPFIGMPNILAKKMIMPEYIQKFNFDKILNEIIRWILDENCLKNKKNELENVIRCFNIQDDSKNTDKHQRIIDKISDFILKFDILKNKK